MVAGKERTTRTLDAWQGREQGGEVGLDWTGFWNGVERAKKIKRRKIRRKEEFKRKGGFKNKKGLGPAAAKS